MIARFILIAAASVALGACGERSQALDVKVVKSDQPAFQGGDARFSAQGWAAGERAGWEQQLRTRAQGQNEYSRAPAAVPQ
ncbi:hypothetical protein [Azohydromonas caseinilytica]|uniref:Lipoprotein n=1 Tax=Azohydromonas caseinilytica TaxID=2728836 RepID=A0A848F636_9BURK|nr:hypothetical protein [Azohydromonas caseinilytica]NML14039.1 hypothetical protein [Azohydromonas caseinilytica]